MNPSSGQTSAKPAGAQPKILCVSLGSIGKRHLRNARALLPGAQIGVWRQHTTQAGLPAGADVRLESRDEALDFAPDAVIVSSPASEHVANAVPFLQRGVPLFLEKPLAASTQDLGDFVQRSENASGFTMVGYVLRFLPVLHALRRFLREGRLGEVHTVRIEVGQYLPDWRPQADYRAGVSAQQKLGGGALLELSHEIDYATWLFGWPHSLQCSSAHLSPLQIDVEDSAHLLLEYPDKRISLQLDFLQRVARMAVQIVASKGTLMADLLKEELVWFDSEHPQGTPWPAEKLPDGNDIYLRQFDLFFHKALPSYRAVYPQTPEFGSWATVAQAAQVLQLVDAAKRASDTGCRQQLAQAGATTR
jgi:predicted dehydrogenase